MQALTLSKRQARRFLLAHQGLWPPHSLAGKTGILEHLQKIRTIQFDPLNIVGHNSDLVLQARLANYRPQMLQELLYRDRVLVDGLDKMMSIYPMEDWPNFQRQRGSAREYFRRNTQQAADILPIIREQIRQQGPLSSIDLDMDESIDWAWAPTRLVRATMESMFGWGELVIHHRVHTRKYYDFAERHISPDILNIGDPNPSEPGYHDWHISRRLGSVGLLWGKASDAWLAMPGIKSKQRIEALNRLVDREEILLLTVEGISAPVYMRRLDYALVEDRLSNQKTRKRAVILAPLDNLLWDRRWIEQLFNFSYVWEVYKPAPERKFGYYVLPILYGDRFVARFEPGWEKERNALVIKNWWWEAGIKQTKSMQTELHRCFKRFQSYLGVNELSLDPVLAKNVQIQWLG